MKKKTKTIRALALGLSLLLGCMLWGSAAIAAPAGAATCSTAEELIAFLESGQGDEIYLTDTLVFEGEMENLPVHTSRPVTVHVGTHSIIVRETPPFESNGFGLELHGPITFTGSGTVLKQEEGGSFYLYDGVQINAVGENACGLYSEGTLVFLNRFENIRITVSGENAVGIWAENATLTLAYMEIEASDGALPLRCTDEYGYFSYTGMVISECNLTSGCDTIIDTDVDTIFVACTLSPNVEDRNVSIFQPGAYFESKETPELVHAVYVNGAFNTSLSSARSVFPYAFQNADPAGSPDVWPIPLNIEWEWGDIDISRPDVHEIPIRYIPHPTGDYSGFAFPALTGTLHVLETTAPFIAQALAIPAARITCKFAETGYCICEEACTCEDCPHAPPEPCSCEDLECGCDYWGGCICENCTCGCPPLHACGCKNWYCDCSTSGFCICRTGCTCACAHPEPCGCEDESCACHEGWPCTCPDCACTCEHDVPCGCENESCDCHDGWLCTCDNCSCSCEHDVPCSCEDESCACHEGWPCTCTDCACGCDRPSPCGCDCGCDSMGICFCEGCDCGCPTPDNKPCGCTTYNCNCFFSEECTCADCSCTCSHIETCGCPDPWCACYIGMPCTCMDCNCTCLHDRDFRPPGAVDLYMLASPPADAAVRIWARNVKDGEDTWFELEQIYAGDEDLASPWEGAHYRAKGKDQILVYEEVYEVYLEMIGSTMYGRSNTIRVCINFYGGGDRDLGDRDSDEDELDPPGVPNPGAGSALGATSPSYGAGAPGSPPAFQPAANQLPQPPALPLQEAAPRQNAGGRAAPGLPLGGNEDTPPSPAGRSFTRAHLEDLMAANPQSVTLFENGVRLVIPTDTLLELLGEADFLHISASLVGEDRVLLQLFAGDTEITTLPEAIELSFAFTHPDAEAGEIFLVLGDQWIPALYQDGYIIASIFATGEYAILVKAAASSQPAAAQPGDASALQMLDSLPESQNGSPAFPLLPIAAGVGVAAAGAGSVPLWRAARRRWPRR